MFLKETDDTFTPCAPSGKLFIMNELQFTMSIKTSFGSYKENARYDVTMNNNLRCKK